MKRTFQRLIDEATRLTRAGDLGAATEAIRAAVSPGRPASAAAATAAAGYGNGNATGPARSTRSERSLRSADAGRSAWVVDVEAREIPEPPHPARASARSESAVFASVHPVKGVPGTHPPPYVEMPEVGSFIPGVHAGTAGRREYKLYIPPDAGGRLLPLIVMLHGCTQDPDDFAAGTAMNEAAFARGFFVLYPAQSMQINPQRCWNWFKHNHQRRGHGEPALIAGMTQEMMSRHAIDGERIYVAGLSAGGAMAAILGDTYPDVFAAVGVHSGLPAGAATDLQSALSAMQSGAATVRPVANGMPTIVFHGDADTRVHPRNGEQIIAASTGPDTATEIEHRRSASRGWTRRIHRDADGNAIAEHWTVHGAAHAWSGGRPSGSYTDAGGPDASGEMVRFFFEHRRRKAH